MRGLRAQTNISRPLRERSSCNNTVSATGCVLIVGWRCASVECWCIVGGCVVQGGDGSVAGWRHGRARAGDGRHGRDGRPAPAPRARPASAPPDQTDATPSAGATPLCTTSKFLFDFSQIHFTIYVRTDF